MRARLEKNSIALLSNRLEPVDAGDPGWLGCFSPREAIRRSHLWNVNHVDEAYDPGFLDDLEEAVQYTLCGNQRGA